MVGVILRMKKIAEIRLSWVRRTRENLVNRNLELRPIISRSLRVVFCLGTNDDGTKYKCKMPLGAPKNLERLRVKNLERLRDP